MNSGIYASYIHPFTPSTQVTWSGLKVLLMIFLLVWQVYFFPHGNINLVGFRVETMALSETFAWSIHFRSSPELSMKLWFCGVVFLLVLGLRCFVCLDFVWCLKYSVSLLASQMKSRYLVFQGSFQELKILLKEASNCSGRKTLSSITYTSYGSYYNILRTPTYLIL